MPVNFDVPDRLEISVPVEGDDDGYLDRECPNENCLSQFKILKDDWDRIEQSGQVVCPFCRHEAPPGSWWTTEQIEHAKAMALEQAKHLMLNSIESNVQGHSLRFQPWSEVQLVLQNDHGCAGNWQATASDDSCCRCRSNADENYMRKMRVSLCGDRDRLFLPRLR